MMGAAYPAPSSRAGRIEAATRAGLDRTPPWRSSDITSIRATYDAIPKPPVPPDPRAARRDEVIDGLPGRPPVRVRRYRPVGQDRELPRVMWLHGGGYVVGSVEADDDRADQMAIALHCEVISVDWRLAPEHPYPAGLDDAEAVWRHLADDRETTSALVLGGGSAGAGLAAALCLRLRDGGVPQPRLQLLIYPMLDDRDRTRSMIAFADPPHPSLWDRETNRLCWDAYIGGVDPIPPTAAPARASDLSGLAPAFVGVGDCDAFLDEDVDYALRLSAAGVPVELHVYPGVVHGGFTVRPATAGTEQFLNHAYEALRAAFDADGG